jgi:cyclopropane-fatty-acyl-phospholipid synthase
MVDGAAAEHFGAAGSLAAEVVVLDPRFYRAIVFGGAVGAGEAFGEGWWTSPDLTAVVRLLVRNRPMMETLETGPARVIQPVRRLWHALRRNTLEGSRRNISAHYDLGNEFFGLFLDETLTYSCGIFAHPGASLREASLAKYDRIAALLDLGPSDHLVEIGTGWGGFALHVATTYGCRVTTTTISEQQFAHATALVAAAGMEDRITLLKQDYRTLDGRFSKLASIEMIEAVGHEHFGTFFQSCARLLAPDGRAVIQAITIADEQYEAARKEVDFIKRHIFPGSCIPSQEILQSTSAAAGLTMVAADEIGLHYAETLRRWREGMRAQRTRLGELGYDDRFQRMWEFYFCYCEGGFLERAIDTLQFTLVPAGTTFTMPAKVPAIPTLAEAA